MTRKQVIQIVSQRRIPLVAITILLVLNFVVYGYLSVYQRPALDRAREEWFVKRRTAAGDRDQSRPTLYAQGRKDLDEWRGRIVAKKDFAPFLSRLFDLTGRHDLQLAGITYKPTLEKESALASYVIGFSVKGKYSGVKSFLSDVMVLRDMVVVDSVSFNSAKATEEQVELKMQLTSYFKMDLP